MKRLILLLVSLALLACNDGGDTGNQKQFDAVFGGNHELRKFSGQERNIPATASASYFLFWGSASFKGADKESFISFSWRLSNGEYVLSKVPMDKVRVKFDNTTNVPFITFGYSKDASDDVYYTTEYQNQANMIIDRDIHYIVVHCKESDYLYDVNINDAK